MNFKSHGILLSTVVSGAIVLGSINTSASQIVNQPCCHTTNLSNRSVLSEVDLHDIDVEEVHLLNGTATKLIEEYSEDIFVVYNVENWDGEEYSIMQADHLIIPIQSYCSPNYEEYKAVKVGYLTLTDENGDLVELPLYREIV